jgi:cytochrome c oxidase subunit IV
MTAHSADQIAHEERRYLQIFLVLGVLTAMEIAVIYMPVPHLAIAFSLVVMAATKAALVALYYMHLSNEKPTLMWIALTPAILCIFLLLMLMPDLSALTRLFAHRSVAAPSAQAAEHGGH